MVFLFSCIYISCIYFLFKTVRTTPKTATENERNSIKLLISVPLSPRKCQHQMCDNFPKLNLRVWNTNRCPVTIVTTAILENVRCSNFLNLSSLTHQQKRRNPTEVTFTAFNSCRATVSVTFSLLSQRPCTSFFR